ncbi:MFS transporter [Kribbella sp. NPDC020789]
MRGDRPVWRRDFDNLWSGLAISQLGSAISGVALPIVAVTVLQASTLQVALLAVMAPVTAALISFPAGTFVEFHRKRPVMIAADLARLISLGSIPVTAALGVLTFWQLCVTSVIGAVANIAFSSASQANLVDLVGRDHLVESNGRLQSTNWLTLSVGPALGGWLVSLISATGAVAADALSFIGSAFAIWRIRTPEPAPPPRTESVGRLRQMTEGLHFAWREPRLRKLLISWVVFAGCVGMTGPVNSIFLLREQGFSALQYGLIMAIGSVGGFLGSRLTKPAVDRFGIGRTLYWGSVLRAPWYVLVPLAGSGVGGVVLCSVSMTGVLIFSALANSAMGSLRQIITPDHLMSRVSTLWSFSTAVGQPVFILVGAQLATWFGTRPVLFAVPVVILLSALILPRGEAPPPAPADEKSESPATGTISTVQDEEISSP